MAEPLRHTIVALVRDRPGVLNRVTSMIRRRSFNISSLAVGHAETPGLSRMTFVVEGDEQTLEQVTKQLRKLIDVVKVSSLNEENSVSRELALIQVSSSAETRAEIIQIVSIFRANIIDVAHASMVIEVTGDGEKLDSLVQLLQPFGVGEIMRSGRLAMPRGSADGADQEASGPGRGRRRARSQEGAEE